MYRDGSSGLALQASEATARHQELVTRHGADLVRLAGRRARRLAAGGAACLLAAVSLGMWLQNSWLTNRVAMAAPLLAALAGLWGWLVARRVVRLWLALPAEPDPMGQLRALEARAPWRLAERLERLTWWSCFLPVLGGLAELAAVCGVLRGGGAPHDELELAMVGLIALGLAAVVMALGAARAATSPAPGSWLIIWPVLAYLGCCFAGLVLSPTAETMAGIVLMSILSLLGFGVAVVRGRLLRRRIQAERERLASLA